MNSARKIDQDYLFECFHRVIEVVSRKTDTEFGFNMKKHSKYTIWMYFSVSGRPKIDSWKFFLHLGCIGGAVDQGDPWQLPIGAVGTVAAPEWRVQQARSMRRCGQHG